MMEQTKSSSNYKVKGIDFSIEDVMDFNGSKIFDGVLGRYGLAQFHRDKKQKFPIKYHILKDRKWKRTVRNHFSI